MRKILQALAGIGIAAGTLAYLWPAEAQNPAFYPQTFSHATTAAITTSLVVKNAPGNLYGFNCSSVTGSTAGFCIAYNAAAAPTQGALTAGLVLDVCYFDTTARGCSLSRIPIGAKYSTGITILMSTAASPYTLTVGTDSGFISADYN
jgi:hypothetical protein